MIQCAKVYSGAVSIPQVNSNIEQFINDATNMANITEDVSNASSYVVPHAGYMYSGKTAAFTYKAIKRNQSIEKIESIVIIEPNHTGNGKPISVSIEDWETPFGKASNDKELSKAIVGNSGYLQIDERAHEGEHSIEVQLPFTQYLFPGKKFVFICMEDQSVMASELLSKAIIKAADELNRRILIIASSDFNHYESAEVAKRKDSKLLDAIKILDYKNFNKLIYETNDSACGFGPITVAMLFARDSGKKKGVILNYTNWGRRQKIS